MTTTQGNRKILDLKRWEITNTTRFTHVGWGMADARQFIYSDHIRQQAMFLAAAGGSYGGFIYSVEEDSFIALAAPGSGSHGRGTCGAASSWSTGATVGVSALTATAGTTTTITTNQTLVRNLAGYPIQIMSGPNAGATLTISSNTIGANSVITVPAQASAFDATTTFRLGTPRWYLFYSATTTPVFRIYDWATNQYVTLSNTGGPASAAGEPTMIATPSWVGDGYRAYATGTATSATSTTLVNNTKTWTTNQWTNYQIRITGGTGAGQIRTITANDATSVTVATWTITPDNTSTYSIEGNDDYLYIFNNTQQQSTIHRYSISANSWTALTPSPARGGTFTVGCIASWISNANDANWSNESSIINGRRVYCTRGNDTSVIEYYDIPSNGWTALSYGNQNMLLGLYGARFGHFEGNIYIAGWNGDVLYWNRFDVVKNELEPWSYMPTLVGGNTSLVFQITGNWAFCAYYKDGNTKIPYIYSAYPTGASSWMMRCMVF